MTRNLLAPLLAALVLAGFAAASTTATPGVSSSTITLGSSGPLTGEAAAAAGVLKGAEGYFKYVNSQGGIFGRKIWETWERTSNYLSSGKVDVSQLITHRFPLDDFQEAMAQMKSGRSGKVVLLPNGG